MLLFNNKSTKKSSLNSDRDIFQGTSLAEVLQKRPIQANYYWTTEINGSYAVFYKSIWVRSNLKKKQAEKFVKKHNKKIEKALINYLPLPDVPFRTCFNDRLIDHINRKRWNERIDLLNKGLFNKHETDFLDYQRKNNIERQFQEHENDISMPWRVKPEPPVFSDKERAAAKELAKSINLHHKITGNRRQNILDYFSVD
jgi:hypothetical protein